MRDNMRKLEVDIYIVRGEITQYKTILGEVATDLIVKEEYTGDVLFLQNDDCITINIQIDKSEYNLTKYISNELGDSNGMVVVNYVIFSDKLDTINPISISTNATKKCTKRIQYNSAEDFESKFNNTMSKAFDGFNKRYMYMEISVHKNSL